MNDSTPPDATKFLCLIRASQIINLYNRINVITQQPAGNYGPGQWA